MNRYNLEKRFLHGGDYNPDQWLQYPDILKEDIELMKLANTNTFSLGIFAWSTLEPEEGIFNFQWLDNIMDSIYQMGGNVILATPSGARPSWMAEKYEEVLRTNEKNEKSIFGGRHNHCFTSPKYREKVAIINEKLAERYANHPALLMWHVSNEYSGECHCDYCKNAFREWLINKYQSLEKLNHAWWGPFWSHSITSWKQINPPSPLGETAVHGLNLDWRRFVTDQTIDFYKHEIKAIRKYSPNIPITTNFMSDTYDLIPFQSLNYAEFSKHVDIVSWDCYPAWHNDWESTADLASKVGFINDQFRSLKQQPFLIMESTPSAVNWHDVNKSKRPGMHLLSSMQLIAHGSDSNLYFQWRKSRGSSEKFHGAVVDHDGSSENRVFKDVQLVGAVLEKIKAVKGTDKKSRVAILYDWENNWALNDAQGFSQKTKRYPQTLQEHYRVFWDLDISVDVITIDEKLYNYDLVIAPMLYLISETTINKFVKYVKGGGYLVSTYLTGLVDETDLAYLGGWPSQLVELFGIELQETDIYYPKQINGIEENNRSYQTKDYLSIVNPLNAKTLAKYTDDFYRGKSAVTVNNFGKGKAYFVGARTNYDYLFDFYQSIIGELDLAPKFIKVGNKNVSIQTRGDSKQRHYFILNFSEQKQAIKIDEKKKNLLTDKFVGPEIDLPPYGVMILSD
ncbi:beta-galactosidase [Aerococcaceae bacterium zg-BR22]|uniref:beta-galactosidase n=1 Tax=Aerococcaceae bacterium zg-1292 TaxID=2774330 RepID=UPI004063B12A|nr:beta-galactosidase [Aerococcaceae bacterium zg-BR22]